MNLIPEWAPNIHPMVVHFPIAILGIAVFFDFVSFFLPKKSKWWTEEATVFLYCVGAAGAFIVYYTGTLAADSVMLPTDAQSILSNHSDWAWYTIWFYGIYAVVRFTATKMLREKHRLKLHTGFFILSLAGLFLLFQTGDHGAQMVFKYGVGVQVADIENSVQHDHETDHEEGTSFTTNDVDHWEWTVSENAVDVLSDNFTFLQGTVEAMNPSVTEEGPEHLMELHPSNSFFVTEQSYGDIQLDLYLSVSDFQGSLAIVHHVQDAENYDYMRVHSDGSAELGRVSSGQENVIEKGEAELQNAETLRLVRAGNHIRGYVDEELIVHGHIDAAPEGAVGLKLEGPGFLSIKEFSLTSLRGEEEHSDESHDDTVDEQHEH